MSRQHGSSEPEWPQGKDPAGYCGYVNWDAAAALAGICAALAATWQLWRLRVDALDARAAEIRSVSIATVVAFRPTAGEVQDGRADWKYQYTIHNPGRLPIWDVQATITFPCEVRRRHYDGSLDEAKTTVSVRAAMIPPQSSHAPRHRTLSIAYEHWPQLESATVRMAFMTPDAGRCVNTWPPAHRSLSRALRRRLQRTHN